MRIASWSWGGRHHVGTVSADGREATPLLVDYAGGAALRLLEALAQGESLPPANRPAGGGGCDHAARAGAASAAQRVVRRPQLSLACAGAVGQRAFASSLPKEHQWPMVFTKFPETVIGPHDAVRLPGKAVSEQIDYESELAVVIGRGGRDIGRARAMDHVLGYTIVNDVSARRAGAPPAVAAGQELRHLLPDGAVDRDGRRTRRARHADPRLGHAGGR